MATLTFVYPEDLEPSERDPELWDTATALGLNVNTVPDLYPGIGGELEIHGSPVTLAQLAATAIRKGIPAKPTRLVFEDHGADLVNSLGWPPEMDLEPAQ